MGWRGEEPRSPARAERRKSKDESHGGKTRVRKVEKGQKVESKKRAKSEGWLMGRVYPKVEGRRLPPFHPPPSFISLLFLLMGIRGCRLQLVSLKEYMEEH